MLYVTTDESYLFMDGDSICVKPPGGEKQRIPAGRLESIVLFGNITVSSPFLAFCMERGIGVTFLNVYGRFLAGVHGKTHGNVLLRLAQHKATQDESTRSLVSHTIIAGKAANMRGMLLRTAHEHADETASAALRAASDEITSIARSMNAEMPVSLLRGYEGRMSREYFSVFNRMIKANSEDFYITSRQKRPPADYTNALLSFVYTLSSHDIRSALDGVGLDPQIGFLHTPRSGRASLALDIIEELRAPLCDRFVLSQINLRAITSDDFIEELGEVRLKDKSRKELLAAWQKRKKDEITHPFLNEKIPIGLIAHIQSRLMTMYLRGDIDAYTPFWWR